MHATSVQKTTTIKFWTKKFVCLVTSSTDQKCDIRDVAVLGQGLPPTVTSISHTFLWARSTKRYLIS